MDYEVNTIEIKDEMKMCPLCEYEDGFHSMFKKDEETLKWLFICPSCHKVFDFGLTLPR
jgi:transposase-like protein